MKRVLLNLFTIAITIVITGLNAFAISVTYTQMDVPPINSSFKTYMDYRAITNHSSNQWKYISTWGWVDGEGFMRCNGERDLGINDDYYLVAMGSYYSSEIGTKFRIKTDTGNQFYVALGDQKANCDTDYKNQYSYNNDILEMIVNTPTLNSIVKLMGTANVYMPLNGSITSIEKMTFNY